MPEPGLRSSSRSILGIAAATDAQLRNARNLFTRMPMRNSTMGFSVRAVYRSTVLSGITLLLEYRATRLTCAAT
jgi:hypothetical protein